MKWFLVSLVWWCGASAIPSPTQETWKCPEISEEPILVCNCDMPHTLRCTGESIAMPIIGEKLKSLNASVSLLDCTIQNLTIVTGPILEGISLHGLVISSGEITEIHQSTFKRLATPLQALGLPNNQLVNVPTLSLSSLPELDRLDLSSNKLKNLDQNSFKGLKNLSFIDVSNNMLSKISDNTFEKLPVLKVLRLRGNRLTLYSVSKLKDMPSLEELDISQNNLVGPLGPKTFPKMNSLADLQLSHNSISSIKMGALQSVNSLTSLSLHHNLIDVIEDHAFQEMKELNTLDLAHNRIVAVSGASLAHLSKLTTLDLRFNYLRALTADLILPLKVLKNLKLDDNDISIIASDALKSNTLLKHLSLSENPLNCDCNLEEFASWLRNSTMSSNDKDTAVCATPPSLENGLLIDIPLENFVCGDEEQESVVAPLSTPYSSRINLVNFDYDGSTVSLEWNVEDGANPYTCDAIFVYEEEGLNEILVESTPIKCNSSSLVNPKRLSVVVPSTIQLLKQHRYRYCLVLFESGQTDDVSLILGCSDVIPLIQNVKFGVKNISTKLPKIMSIQANLTSFGSLSIFVNLYPQGNCELNLALLEQNSLISQRKINCSSPNYLFVGLRDGPYRVCASFAHLGVPLNLIKSKCVNVVKAEHHGFTTLDVAFVSIFSILCFMVLALVCGVRKVLLKPKIETHQCFMPPEIEERQHNRYVKLQATTNL